MGGRGSAGRVTIVKLGGSLAGSALLPRWLDALADCAGRVVVVPGGGPFADAVRVAQPLMGFDDSAAHRMAVLAMDQYAYALANLHAKLKLADSIAALRRVLRDRAVPVWLPARLVLDAAEIPASWDVTSDSLAAWLAGKMRAKHVILVKLSEIGREPVSAATLASQGVVDAAFPGFLKASGASARILEASDPGSLAAVLDSATDVGTRIMLP
jgi:aspartokinase-like uncharacterized kinase